jgi:integrase
MANKWRTVYSLDSPSIHGHTQGHINCPLCEASLAMVNQETNLSELKLKDAAPLWLKSREKYISPKTHDLYRQFIKKGLEPFFGDIRLLDIHVGHLREYQEWRQRPYEQMFANKNGEQRRRVFHAHESTVNHELNCLSQILRRAGLWHKLKDHYEPLRLPKLIPQRVMSEEEEDRFFQVASTNPAWFVAYCASSLSANTTAAGCEIRGLRLKDIDLQSRPDASSGLIYVPDNSVKNEFRARVIPLNARARLQVERLLHRAKCVGSYEPDHYLIPFRVKRGTYDPQRPTMGWRTAFREVRAAAGLPWLRQHDLRHQAITKLLERADVSEETVKAIAGHVSKKILDTYSHIRIKAKGDALMGISKPVSSAGDKKLNRKAFAI